MPAKFFEPPEFDPLAVVEAELVVVVVPDLEGPEMVVVVPETLDVELGEDDEVGEAEVVLTGPPPRASAAAWKAAKVCEPVTGGLMAKTAPWVQRVPEAS